MKASRCLITFDFDFLGLRLLTIEPSLFAQLLSSPSPPPSLSPPTMRLLLTLALFVLSLALGQATAREMAGLRRLSASNDASAASSTSVRSSATSSKSLPEITLYGEALCPDTAAFVSRILGPLLDAGAIAGSGGKGGSGTGKAAATPSAPSSRADVASAAASSLPSSLASEPGGGYLCPLGRPGPDRAPRRRRPRKAPRKGLRRQNRHDQLGPDSENAPAASFRFVAWGKAKRSSSDGKITCQHGSKECELNKLLECAQAKQRQASGASSSFPATLRCYFAALGKAGGGSPASLEKCVGDDALWAKISSCAAGPEGLALEAAAGTETLDKQSALTFVPWVVVDGKQLAEECGSALKVACESSKAKGVSPLAPACSRLPELTSKSCPGAS